MADPWVEIIEPRSREKMFVNLVTGECGWDEPIGVKIRRVHEQEGHQWWELFDVKTSRYYYYNSSTQQTSWQKPKNNSSIIIPLAKLQLLKQNGSTNGHSSRDTRDVSCQTKNSCLVLVNNSTQTTPPPSLRRGMCYGPPGDYDTWSTKRSLRSYLINEARFARGLSGVNQEEVSDYDEDFWESEDEEEDGSSTSDQWDADDEIESNPEDPEDDDDDQDDFHQDDSQVREKKPLPSTPDKMAPEEKKMTEPNHHEYEVNPEEETDEDVANHLVDENHEDETDGGKDDERTESSDSFNKGSLLETSSFIYVRPSPSPSATTKSASFTGGLGLTPKDMEKLEQLSRNLERLSTATSSGDQTPEKKPPPPPPHHKPKVPPPPQRVLSLSYDNCLPSPPKIGPVHASPPSLKASPSLSVASQGSPALNIMRNSRDAASGDWRRERPVKDKREATPSSKESREHKLAIKEKLPKLGSGSVKSSQEQIMEKFARENVARHIKRGVGNQLLKRKTSLKAMLTWSKKSIKQPMIATLISGNSSNRNDIKAEAIHCFKLIQCYMGDRTPSERSKDPVTKESIAFELISIACTKHEMRDEIYVQLCRQTTENPRKSSVVAGLELMASCLSYFSPSVKFSPYLASFLTNSPLKESPPVDREDRESLSLIDHSYHLLIKARGSHLTGGGAVGTIYCRKPVAPKELEMVSDAIFRRFPGIFGESLDALMVLQRDRWPHRKLPWILVTLCEAVLKTGGASTEGIFRIAADTDELAFIKLVIDCINFDLLEDEGDILILLNHTSEEPIDVHIFACLLKQWFRNLMEPVIPFSLYETCLEVASSPRDATSLIMERMPKQNKMVIGYLIRFLQVFSAPENVNNTKMDDSNLSMVWAPNILRSSQSPNPLMVHPSIIFENTRKEMTFIRTLIQSLDTSFIQGVY